MWPICGNSPIRSASAKMRSAMRVAALGAAGRDIAVNVRYVGKRFEREAHFHALAFP